MQVCINIVLPGFGCQSYANDLGEMCFENNVISHDFELKTCENTIFKVTHFADHYSFKPASESDCCDVSWIISPRSEIWVRFGQQGYAPAV